MDVFLLRHGIAEEPQARSGRPDSERRLTDKGIQRVQQIARAMRAMELEFELILSSPFPRARETAEIVAGFLQLDDRLQLTGHLAIPPSSAKLIGQINGTQPLPQSVLLVGHEPHLSSLASLLLAGTPSVELVLKKGGLCRLEVSGLQAARCASLVWLLTPRQMLLMS
jgi:phosphohistidine phosphatase